MCGAVFGYSDAEMGSDHDAYFEEVEARFDRALDFDLGLEEEFQVLDPETLALTPGFEALRDSAPERLRGRIAGELLRSEIEVSTPRTLHFGQAAKQLLLNRTELFAHAESQGYALGSTGTHPFSGWKDQEIIDTPHYRLVEDRLKYVAWRNNTWAAHVHIGVRGCDRAMAVCDALRTYLAAHPRAVGQLAVHRGRVDAAALGAHADLHAHVPALRHPRRVRLAGRSFRSFYEELIDTNCIQEFTQIWWSVRPHHRFGTVEIRICDAQTEAWQSLAISSLTVGLVAHLARVYDEGMPLPILPTRYVEENLWRAIRYGLDGSLVDWATAHGDDGGRRHPAPRRAVRALRRRSRAHPAPGRRRAHGASRGTALSSR